MGYDSAPSRLQSGGNKSPLPLPVNTSRRICPGAVSAHWEADGIYTGHISGHLTLPISSTFETPSSSSAKRIRCIHSSIKRSQGRASMVAGPPRCMEWSCASTPSTRPRDRDRCFEEGLGGSMAGCENRGIMVPDGAQTAHQLLGTVSRFSCSEQFCEGSIISPCETSHGQHFGCSLCKPSWGNKVSSSLQFGAMGMGSQTEYFSKCRTPCRTHERYGRLAVSSLPRFEQLAVMPQSLSGFDADSRDLCHGPLCRQTEYPVASVLQLETNSNGSRSGCLSTRLVEGKELCLPSVLLDHEGTGKVAGTRRGTDTSHTIVAHTGFVSHLPEHVSVFTGSSAHEQQSPIRASRGDTPTDFEQDSSVSRVACIKRSLQSKDICANASKLILAAWRPGTNAIYNSAWKKWHTWCLSRQVDSFRPTLADITGFLAHSFDEGLEIRTLNTYRSALSGVLPPIDGFPVSQHPLVVRFIKRCTQSPSCYSTLSTILTHGHCVNLFANEDLSLRSLTQKLAILLAISAPKRSSELKLLDLRFMRILPEGAEFQLPGLTKTSSEVFSVFFAKYSVCEKLCVLQCLQCYIMRTSSFCPVRCPNTASQLLLRYHRPYHPVQSCSIARWNKSILGSAGIDTAIFKGHSTRSASTSKARAINGGLVG